MKGNTSNISELHLRKNIPQLKRDIFKSDDLGPAGMTWDLQNLFLHLEKLDDIGCCKFRGMFNKSDVTSSEYIFF